MDDTLTRALDVNLRNLALGHPTFEADGATFVRNDAFRDIYDANFVCKVTASTADEVERLLARARTEYAHCGELTFRLDPQTPAAFEARLALDGYERAGSLLMILEGPLLAAERPCGIRLIEDAASWEAYHDLKRADWREHAPKLGEDGGDLSIADGLSGSNRAKCPPVRYFMAYQDGRAVGFFSAWEGIDRVGQVEDLFVLPEYRRRGIATALIHHCVADARARGAGAVIIVADPKDTPKNIYAAMGWRPLAALRHYGLKQVTGEAQERREP
jgi:ribosomal protein S18 acetylase RimI-like enzyme